MSDPILKITDGTTSIDLIARSHGFHLSSWRPRVPDIKNGGIFRDSPLVDGRSIVYRKNDNWVDTFELKMTAISQDDAYDRLNDLRVLLDRAVDYWTTQYGNIPVWLEARGSEESNTRYAVIVDYRLEEEDNPYAQPFFTPNCEPAMNNLTLVVEHIAWQNVAPGSYECIAMLTGAPFLSEITTQVVVDAIADDGSADINTTSISTNSTIAAINTPGNDFEGYIRFINVPINELTYSKRVILRLKGEGGVNGTLRVYIEDSDDAVQVASYADYAGRTWITTYSDIEGDLAYSIDDYFYIDVSALIKRLLNTTFFESGNALQFRLVCPNSSESFTFYGKTGFSTDADIPRLMILDDDYYQEGFSVCSTSNDRFIYTDYLAVPNYGGPNIGTFVFDSVDFTLISSNFPYTFTSGRTFTFVASNGGTFMGIAVDITSTATVSSTTFQYYNGASWTDLKPSLLNAFPDLYTDLDTFFESSGKKIILFSPPTGWAPGGPALSAPIYGFGVRLSISTSSGSIIFNTMPILIQDPGILVSAENNSSSLPSLLRIRYRGTSIEAPTSVAPEYTILAGRSISRGTEFCPFLPLTDRREAQGSSGDAYFWVDDGDGAFTSRVQGIDGRVVRYTAPSLKTEATYDSGGDFTFSPGAVSHWAGGKYHAFLRTFCTTDSGQVVKVRVRVSGIVPEDITTKWVATNNITDVPELVDLGSISIPYVESTYGFTVNVDVFQESGTLSTIDFVDVILMPTDEMYALISHSDLTHDDISVVGDSASNPKNILESISYNRKFGQMTTQRINDVVSTGPLYAPARQWYKIWMLGYAETSGVYAALPQIAAYIEYFGGIKRYYVARGAR